MDPILKAKWLAALRSGEYKQTRGQLRSRDGKEHCCLGVLCEVAGERICSFGLSLVNDRGVGSYEAISRIIGGPYARTSELFRMNDTGKTFAEIADHIEATL